MCRQRKIFSGVAAASMLNPRHNSNTNAFEPLRYMATAEPSVCTTAQSANPTVNGHAGTRSDPTQNRKSGRLANVRASERLVDTAAAVNKERSNVRRTQA